MLKPKKTYPNAPEYTALKMHGNVTNDQILVKKKQKKTVTIGMALSTKFVVAAKVRNSAF